MGFLFDRKGRNETDGRREGVAKKSASVLAAVAVAGGSAVVGVPEAEALPVDRAMFFRKLDENGELLGGSRWKLEYTVLNAYFGLDAPKVLERYVIYVEDGLTEEKFNELGLRDKERREAYIREHFGEYEPPSRVLYDDDALGHTDMFGGAELASEETDVWLNPDVALLDGEIALGGFGSYRDAIIDPSGTPITIDSTPITFSEVSAPDGYTSCDASGLTSATFHDDAYEPIDFNAPPKPRVIRSPKTLLDSTGRVQLIDQNSADEIKKDFSSNEEGARRFDPLRGKARLHSTSVAADFTNCKIPEPTTVTETVTETPEPSTTTVTPPTTTVTLPSTVTTTVTPPATTVTETPKTETTTATTTESATTTVTETPQTETVTETPQRETVTLTPENETETVTETPQKETVTETPKTETVTHTPEKETVTETPKASTETSTVTAPQVTVTETPKQVTETTTLPQKTVTEQVPTTVVENKTETVKVPPVTVTKTEKQEPTTVTATPEKVTETVKVPGEKTTVVETRPGEPTTVRETVTETPDVPAVVEQPTPNAPVVDTPDTPVIPGAFSGTVVWDEDRSKHVNDGDERIPGLTVVAFKDGKEIARTTTDENGFYKFDNLEPGEYGIAVYGPDRGELFFEDKAATVVAGEEDTGNDWGFVREDAPAPVEEGKPATPVETVRMTLATTGANSFALAGLGAVLAALVALAVVSRRKVAHQ